MILNRIGVVAAMMRQNLRSVDLAERAGVGYPAICKARTGKPIREATARKIAAALGVNLEDLKEATS